MEIGSSGETECPYCDSKDIEWDEVPDDPETNVVTCKNCGRSWNENLAIVSISIPEDYERDYMEHQYIKKMCRCTHPNEICPIHDKQFNGIKEM